MQVLFATIAVLAIAAWVLNPVVAYSQSTTTTTTTTTTPATATTQAAKTTVNPKLPDDILKIVQNSCMKCHGTGGNGMAMSMVNFSEWDTYNAEKQAKKASLMCKEVKADKMPPASFRKANPDKVPTAAQVETICKWATTLNPPKK